MSSPDGATWRSGYATVCKTVYTSSILVVASINRLSNRYNSACYVPATWLAAGSPPVIFAGSNDLLEPAIRERSFPQRAWLKSIFFAKTPVEIGDIAKSARQHDIGDFHHIVAAGGQHAMDLLQSKFENVFGKADAVFMQQVVHVSGRQA